jgi:uncharacterized repeat protein (TIGR04061 family)
MSNSSRVIDQDLLDALMVPAKHSDYAGHPRAFVRIDASLRVYWHTLFDVCPGLLEISPPDGGEIFGPFMAWAAEENLSMNWTYYLWVGRWLMSSKLRERIDRDVLLSLMGASAAAWAIRDRGPSRGLVIGCAGLPELVMGWKCRTVDGGRDVESLVVEETLPKPKEYFGFFTTTDSELSHFPGWLPIPR